MPTSDLNLHDRAQSLKGERSRLAAALAAVDAKLELIEELIGGQDGADLSNGSHPDMDHPQLDMRPDVTLKDAVREAVLAQTGTFKKKDIEARVRRTYPTLPFSPKSIENPFQSMVKEGLIVTHRKKYGQSAALFRRT